MKGVCRDDNKSLSRANRGDERSIIIIGRRLNDFLGLSLNDWTILFLVTLLGKTISVGQDSLCITTLALSLGSGLLGQTIVQDHIRADLN